MSSVGEDEYLSLDKMKLQELFNKLLSLHDNYELEKQPMPEGVVDALRTADRGVRVQIPRLALLNRQGWYAKPKNAFYIIPLYGQVQFIDIDMEIEERERKLRLVLKRLLAPADSIYRHMDDDEGMSAKEVIRNDDK